MSYAHTKRRKLIALLKRKFKGRWKLEFDRRCEEARKRLDGPFLGTLEDLIK